MIYRLAATITMLALVSGCGKAADETSNSVAETMIEQAASEQGIDADVKISQGEAQISMEATTERGTETFQTGQGVAMPSGFPDDIPVPEGLKLHLANTAEEGGVFNIQGESPLGLDALMAFYKTETAAQGWTEVSSNAMAGVMTSLEYEKDGRVLRVIATTGQGITSLTINTERK